MLFSFQFWGTCWYIYTPAYSVPGTLASSIRHIGSSIQQRPHRLKSWTMCMRKPITSKSPFSSASTHLQPSTRQAMTHYSNACSADRVLSDWNDVVMAAVLPQRPVTVRQARQPPVTSSQPHCSSPSRICTGTHPVCHLLQSSGWRHSWAWYIVPSVHLAMHAHNTAAGL